MKSFRLRLLILSTLLILTSCAPTIDNIDNISMIDRPNSDLSITGIWNKIYEYNISEESEVAIDKTEEMFISDKVIEFKDAFILDPNISSRLVNSQSYLNNRIATLPSKFSLNEQSVIYKFSNNISTSQEFLDMGDGKLLTIYLGNINIYEKSTEIDREIVDSKYQEVSTLTIGNQGIEESDFGLAISFRQRDTNVNNLVKYNYYTYYIKKVIGDTIPSILKVNDVVVPKTTGLWTIRQYTVDNSSGGYVNSTLEAFPTFIEDDEKTNLIQDNIFRRIDYVNRDYISLTNFNYTSRSISESYNIFNLHDLASKDPISVTEIAGSSGEEVYQTTFKENANQIFSSRNIYNLDLEPNLDNIGIQRMRNGWKFVSGIDQEINIEDGSRVYRKFDLNITPVTNIARTEPSTISWRDILSRSPGALDATISPENEFVLVQTNSSIEFYPVYYNFIGNEPLFSIQNTEGYEAVMVQWVSDESINNYYNEFLKLPKLNNNIIYTR